MVQHTATNTNLKKNSYVKNKQSSHGQKIVQKAKMILCQEGIAALKAYALKTMNKNTRASNL